MAHTTFGYGEISVILDGKEVELGLGSWSLDTGEEEDGNVAELSFDGLVGHEFSCTFEPTPELTEPLGLVDQLTWGPRLN